MSDAPAAKRPRTDAPADPLADLDKELDMVAELFDRYGTDAVCEIEARIKNVNQKEFYFIKTRLDGASVFKREEIRSKDIAYATHFGTYRARIMADGPRYMQSAVFMEKKKIRAEDVTLITGDAVRIAVASEIIRTDIIPSTYIDNVRLKTRYSYNYKDEMLYELTVVQSGPSESLAAAAPPEFEVELEWCGQSKYKSSTWDPKMRAASFLAKIKDLLKMKMDAAHATVKIPSMSEAPLHPATAERLASIAATLSPVSGPKH